MMRDINWLISAWKANVSASPDMIGVCRGARVSRDEGEEANDVVVMRDEDLARHGHPGEGGVGCGRVPPCVSTGSERSGDFYVRPFYFCASSFFAKVSQSGAFFSADFARKSCRRATMSSPLVLHRPLSRCIGRVV